MSLLGKLMLCLVVMVFFVPACFASPYVLMTGGGGGAAKAGSIGFEAGGTRAIKDVAPLACEITVAFTGNAPSGLLDYPVPHDSFVVIGERNNDPEYGVLLKSGYTIDNFSIMGGVGASFQEKVVVAQSTATGWYYTQSSDTKVNAQVYAGALYKIERIILSAGYDNRRGIVGGLGYSW